MNPGSSDPVACASVAAHKVVNNIFNQEDSNPHADNPDFVKAMKELELLDAKTGTIELDDNIPPCRKKMANILQSHLFATITVVMILCDLVMIVMDTDRMQGCEAKVANMYNCKPSPTINIIASWTILTFYIIETCVRLYTFQAQFHKDVWNILDAVVCITSILYVLSGSLIVEFRPIRIFRVFRLIRIVKFVMGLRELYLVKAGFGSMLRTLFWSSLLLLLLLTFVSIMTVEFVYPVTEELHKSGECLNCWMHFSSVLRTDLTFFHLYILGDDWADVCIPIIRKSPETAIIFVGMALLIFLGIGNLIMAIIVERAAEAREEDKEYQKQLQAKIDCDKKAELLQFCFELDSNQDGTLSMSELQSLCKGNHGARQALKTMNIQSDELECVFSCLDTDGSGDISYVEFVDSLFKVKNADISFMLMSIKHHLLSVQTTVASQATETHQILTEQNQLVTDLSRMMQEMRELFRTSYTPDSPNSSRKRDPDTLKVQGTDTQNSKQEGKQAAVAVPQLQGLIDSRDGQVTKNATADEFAYLQQRVLTHLAAVSEQVRVSSSEQAWAWSHSSWLLQKLDVMLQDLIPNLNHNINDATCNLRAAASAVPELGRTLAAAKVGARGIGSSQVEPVNEMDRSTQIGKYIRTDAWFLKAQQSPLDMSSSFTELARSPPTFPNPVEENRSILEDKSTIRGARWLAAKMQQRGAGSRENLECADGKQSLHPSIIGFPVPTGLSSLFDIQANT